VDEDSVRTLLTRIADTPEPLPARIDIERARRDGRRRQLTARAAVPVALAAAALVAGVIVTVPHALSSPPERARPAMASSQPAAPVPVAPAQFNPLVPYAAFGWLPSGFSEGAVSPLWGNPFESAPASLTLGAEDAGLRTLLLTVNARGACQVSATRPVNSTAQCLIVTGDPGTSKAPDVNGRPAWYFGYGGQIAWEYARDAWATLDTGVDETTPAGSSQQWVQQRNVARRAAARGWTLSPAGTGTGLRDGRSGTAFNVPAAVKDGQLITPSAQTRALLHQIASTVKFGATQPVVFPFRLTGGLPAGWQLSPLYTVTFRPSGGKLLGSGISAGSAADPTALSVGASAPDGYGCNFVAGQSSYVTEYGVSWVYRVIDEVDKHVEMLCSTEPVDGLDVGISLDMNTPGSNAPLPGSASLGGVFGVFGVFTRMKFLGTDPSRWTSAPLG
jgi:hypothetical protein